MKKKNSVMLKAAGITAGVVGALGFTVFHEIMHRDASLPEKMSKFINKQPEPAEPAPVDDRSLWFYNQVLEEFEIINARGFRLKGYLLPSDKPSKIYVFCSHGYRNCGSGEFHCMAKFYHDKGWNVFLVDHQAAGMSEGKYIGFGYHECRDSLQWLDFMNNHFGSDIKIVLHGVSMGSATVMMMSGSGRLPSNVKFTVADCGYTSAYDQFVHNAKGMHVPSFPIVNVASLFNRLISGFDFKDASPLEAVKNTVVPIIFIHGGNDDFVPTRMVNELYNACSSENKELLIVEGAAHAESYPTDSESYEALINGYSEKFL
ncbi:MAG: alpha/beta hydrolase [Clostridia bacterium]|nr:alpha/beta hydrolase [Clostridia bacterium]